MERFKPESENDPKNADFENKLQGILGRAISISGIAITLAGAYEAFSGNDIQQLISHKLPETLLRVIHHVDSLPIPIKESVGIALMNLGQIIGKFGFFEDDEDDE